MSSRTRQNPTGAMSMRALLAADPFLPHDLRQAIAKREELARQHLVRLGANECEAAELLDEPRHGSC
ncbi:MAG TPA: hypothetical protein VHW01_22705 [Polyangiaceae bacterium]|nr:hypothetical protein [Polyangiaceae bacterium]